MFKLFPTQLDQLPAMLVFVCDCAKSFGFEEACVKKVELACEEALVNIMEHGYVHSNGNITLECLFLDSQGIKIIITDEGVPFNPILNTKASQSPAISKSTGGYGIHLMLNLMDKVTYVRENDKNKLTLIKYKSHAEKLRS